MRIGWQLAIAGWLAFAAWGLADEFQIPEPVPLNLLPVRGDNPVDLPPLLPVPDPMAKKSDGRPIPKREPGSRRADYDHAYNYLPEQNPGPRLAPCPCLPLGRWWLDGAYFLGTTRSDRVPALAIAGGNGNPNSPGSQVVSGDAGLTHRFRSGLRLETGLWLDRCQNFGLEGTFFNIESNRAGFGATSNGDRVLSRPYYLQGIGQTAEVIAGPGIGSGSISVQSPLSVYTGSANVRTNWFCEDRYRVDALFGYRYLSLNESLIIQSRRAGTNGSIREVLDDFQTGNQFHGGQVGLAGEMRWDRIYLNASTTIAFGRNRQDLDIAGATRTSSISGTTVDRRGLLVLPSNTGRTRDKEFAVIPETSFVFGYQVGEHWRAFVGYSFLYASNMARPGQAVDLTVNPNQVTGLEGVRPFRMDPANDFWVQGIQFGLEMRY